MTSPVSKMAKSLRPRSNPQASNLGSICSGSCNSQHNEAKYFPVGVFLIVML